MQVKKVMLGKLFKSKKSPEKTLELIMREVNEKIPQMNRDVSILKENLTNLQKDLVDLQKKENTLTEKMNIAVKNNKTELLETIEETLSVVKSSLEVSKSQLSDMEWAYKNSLDSMKNYIQIKEKEMHHALLQVQNHERDLWQKKCNAMLKSFANNINGDLTINNMLDNEDKTTVDALNGDDDLFLLDKVKRGYERIKNLKELSKHIGKEKIKAEVETIIHLADLILEDMKKKPKDVRKERLFLSYYLQSVLKIIESYVTFSNQEIQPKEVKKYLRKTEKLLFTIEAAFKKILEKIMEDEIIGLKTEIELLDNVLKSEGYELKTDG